MRHWIKHGFWNTLEHGITRLADAATSLILLSVLAPEVFSRLALAQAWVAPLLFVFVQPEAILYRDFSKWQSEGEPRLRARISALRHFAWGKILAAMLLSILVWTFFWKGDSDRLYGLLWAFSLALAPQIAGPDRECLRLQLRLKELNLLSLYQKLSLFIGTALVARTSVLDSTLPLLVIAAFSTLSTALLARFAVERSFTTPRDTSIRDLEVIQHSLTSFSIWNHLMGVVLGWVQTMDLFILGLGGFTARELGLYGAILKLANFAQAIPSALNNLFAIWIGRRTSEESELHRTLKYSGLFFLMTATQAILILVLAPWIITLLSHGKWSLEEQHQLLSWMKWIVGGSVFVSSSLLINSWIVLRKNVHTLFFQVYLPWGSLALVIYFISARSYGIPGVAFANLGVGIIYLLLLLGHVVFSRSK